MIPSYLVGAIQPPGVLVPSRLVGAGVYGLEYHTTTPVAPTPATVNTGGPLNDGNLLTDGGLEATYTSGQCNSLSVKAGSPTLTQSADVHGGSKAQQFTAVAQYNSTQWGWVITTAGWYSGSIWAKRTAGASGSIQLRITENGIGSTVSLPVISATYARYVATRRVAAATQKSLGIWDTILSPTDTIIFDDGSLAILSLPSLLSNVVASPTNAMIDCKITSIPTGTQAGLVARIDNPANPANFVQLVQDVGNVKLDEVVAGVYQANLLTAASAFAAGDTLRLWLFGNAWKVYKIVAAGTVTLLGSGTLATVTGGQHGLFATDAATVFSKFDVWTI